MGINDASSVYTIPSGLRRCGLYANVAAVRPKARHSTILKATVSRTSPTPDRCRCTWRLANEVVLRGLELH